MKIETLFYYLLAPQSPAKFISVFYADFLGVSSPRLVVS